MAGKWMAGIVESDTGDGPPTAERWRPVSVPDWPTALTDVPTGEGLLYRTSFTDPRADHTERTRLALRGALGLETVWINGVEHAVDATDRPFVPTLIEFDPAPENELIVAFHPSPTPGGIDDGDGVPPAFSQPGIRWGVDLQVRPETFIDRLEARPRLEGDAWVIDVQLEIDVGPDSSLDDAVTLTLRPEGFRGGGTMDRVSVEGAAGGRTTVSTTLEVRNPSLWWPRGYGDQHRYTLRAKLGADATETVVGLRSVERTDDGLLVNGKPVRGRGIERLPGDDPEADVRLAIDANATLLRARGHVPRPALYDVCDERGVLVWQDLPVGDGPLDAEPATELASAVLEHYGQHPSLACIGIQNDPVDPFEEPIGSGRLGRLAFRWRTWRASADTGDARSVAETVPSRYATVPVTGPPGLEATATTLHPGWRYLALSDLEWLLDRYPSVAGMVGSFGAASLTDDGVPPDRVPGVDGDLLERHADTAETSRTYQATVLRTVAEALRRRESALFVASSLRDPGPGGGPGILTTAGNRKPAFDALQTAYEPVVPVLDWPPVPGERIGISLLNDTPDLLETTVSWQAGDNSGETAVTVNAMGVATAGSVDVPSDAEVIILTVNREEATVENRYHL